MKQSKQGLQRFTDFEAVRTKEDILNLKETGGEDVLEELQIWILEKLNEGLTSKDPASGVVDKYYNRLERLIEVVMPEKLEDTRHTRWQINKGKIESFIHKTILTANRLPAHTEIAEGTGLSRVTVNKHLKEGAASDLQKEELDSYRLMTGNVLNALYKIGMKENNIKALKFFLDYVKEPSPTVIKEQNNYLQINNTRVDEVTVNQLPDAARLQIETIIKQYQTA